MQLVFYFISDVCACVFVYVCVCVCACVCARATLCLCLGVRVCLDISSLLCARMLLALTACYCMSTGYLYSLINDAVLYQDVALIAMIIVYSVSVPYIE